mmetsp:Transcript_48187/g.79880  ORF Transcript_48187/g.79880 Transcript_48187/m.79880 type:complete len:206 (-) Transcript_48187:674-1291(-)
MSCSPKDCCSTFGISNSRKLEKKYCSRKKFIIALVTPTMTTINFVFGTECASNMSSLSCFTVIIRGCAMSFVNRFVLRCTAMKSPKARLTVTTQSGTGLVVSCTKRSSFMANAWRRVKNTILVWIQHMCCDRLNANCFSRPRLRQSWRRQRSLPPANTDEALCLNWVRNLCTSRFAMRHASWNATGSASIQKRRNVSSLAIATPF